MRLSAPAPSLDMAAFAGFESFQPNIMDSMEPVAEVDEVGEEVPLEDFLAPLLDGF